MQSRLTSTVCLLVACLLLALGSFLWLDNTTVKVSASDLGDRGSAGEIGCSIAPWDAGLNDNRAGPGGEHSAAFVNEVAADCYSANMTRFNAGIGSGALALLVLSVGVVAVVRSLRSTKDALPANRQ